MSLRASLLRLAAVVGWAALALYLAMIALSAGLSPETNWTMRGLVAGFCVLAVVRPDAALLVVTAFVGFGTILAHLTGVPPFRMTEVLVVVALAGCSVAAARSTRLARPALGASSAVPVALFAITAATSTIVWLRVDQFRSGYASDYLQHFFYVLTHDYFTAPGDFWLVVSTHVVLEGLALFVFTATLCRTDGTFFPRAVRMLAIGGAGVGLMSVVRLVELLLRNPEAIAAARATSIGLRISPQIGDYIAAGSYFGLCWLTALGLGAASTQARRIAWLAAGLPLLAAVYLTGSRSVIAAAVAGIVFLAFAIARRHVRLARGVVVFAGVAAVAMILSYRWMSGRDIAGEAAMQSLNVRYELVRTGLRVIETRPAFGVGLDRFFVAAALYASPELRALWGGRLNPHNDFLRFGAELGLIGLVLFVWILAAAGRRVWSALDANPDPRLAGLAGGLVAFLVTSLVSNPLMVREVSYAFWIALGLAAGQATRQLEAPGLANAVPAVAASVRRPWRGAAAGLAAVALILSVPPRAAQEITRVNVSRLSYGLFDWGVDADGTAWRWSGPRAALFVSRRATSVVVPLVGNAPGGAPQQVEIRVDGRLAYRVAIGTEPQRLHVILPPRRSRGPRRIDLSVTPTWVPAEVISGNQDRRVLGVKVGELQVTM